VALTYKEVRSRNNCDLRTAFRASLLSPVGGEPAAEALSDISWGQTRGEDNTNGITVGMTTSQSPWLVEKLVADCASDKIPDICEVGSE